MQEYNLSDFISGIGFVLPIALGLASLLWQAWRENKLLHSQKRNLDTISEESEASASKSFAEAAKIETNRNIEMRKELDIAKGRLEEAEKRITALEVKEKEYENIIYDLKDWGDRLCHQVHSLGGDPVKIRSNS